jgi:hypothetical protein
MVALTISVQGAKARVLRASSECHDGCEADVAAVRGVTIGSPQSLRVHTGRAAVEHIKFSTGFRWPEAQ